LDPVAWLSVQGCSISLYHPCINIKALLTVSGDHLVKVNVIWFSHECCW